MEGRNFPTGADEAQPSGIEQKVVLAKTMQPGQSRHGTYREHMIPYRIDATLTVGCT